MASILVERVFDGLTMILFLLLAALIGGIPGAQSLDLFGESVVVNVRYILWLAIAVFGVALGGIYAIELWPRPIHKVAEWLIVHLTPQRFHRQLMGIGERFIGSFSVVRSVGTLTLGLLFSSSWSKQV